MGKQKITMTIDEKTFSVFKALCKSKAMKVSSKVELMIQEFVEQELAKQEATAPQSLQTKPTKQKIIEQNSTTNKPSKKNNKGDDI